MPLSSQLRIWRIIAASLTLAALVLGAWLLLVQRPHQQAHAARLGELQQALTAFSVEPTAEQPEPAVIEDAEALARSCAQRRELLADLPTDAGRTSLRFALEELARRAQVNLVGMEGAPDLRWDGLGSIGVRLTLEGDAEQIRTFINLVGLHPRLTTLHDLALSLQPLPADAEVDEDELSREERRRRRRARRAGRELPAAVFLPQLQASLVVRSYHQESGEGDRCAASGDLAGSPTDEADAP